MLIKDVKIKRKVKVKRLLGISMAAFGKKNTEKLIGKYGRIKFLYPSRMYDIDDAWIYVEFKKPIKRWTIMSGNSKGKIEMREGCMFSHKELIWIRKKQ